MDNIPKLLCFSTLLFLSISANFCLAQNDDQFIYNGFKLEANLALDGVAKIHPNGLLQLTNTSKQVVGHAFFRAPMTFNDLDFSFSTSFVFAMVPEVKQQSGGHGLAFTISSSPSLSQNATAQYLGLLNSSTNNSSASHVFAIELDSVMSVDMRDINPNHIGVDLNSLISVDSAPVSYYSSHERKNITLELMSEKPMQVWIDYDGEERKVNVTIAPVRIPKPDRPLLSTPVNLSMIFLEHMYVGFSAATGTVASSHYILGWSFSRTGPAQSLDILKLPKVPRRKESKSQKQAKVIVALSVVTGTLLVAALVGGSYVLRKRRYSEIREDWEKIYGPQRLSYKALYKATSGFREKELIGEGGFGKVYRGTLASTQSQVAVKKVSHDSDKGMEQFVAEIAAMGRLKHRNLVQLVGYCRRKGELILVYDYMPNGSLDQYLFSNERPCLSWSQRVRVLRDVASALLYLHEEWEQVVLHRDVKASNVLLDEDFNGRLGDFGLAMLRDRGADAHTTRVVGTVGYLAPEISRTGRASTESDVFSFGVFMLEVACGRRPLRPGGPVEEIILVDWVMEHSKKGYLLGVCDPKLGGDFDIGEMELVLKLGLLCLSPVPAQRPTMRQVIQYLDSKASYALPQLQAQEVGTNSLSTFFAADESPNPATSFLSSFGERSSTHKTWSSTD